MKKVKVQLVGIDGNAFAVMGIWSRAARQQGWTKEEIDKVLKEAMSGDYDHLLATIVSNSEDIDGDDDEDEYVCPNCGGFEYECNCDDEECEHCGDGGCDADCENNRA